MPFASTAPLASSLARRQARAARSPTSTSPGSAALEAGGGVHGLTCDAQVSRPRNREDLAGLDPYPHRKLAVELGNPLGDGQPRRHGAIRVVAVGDRCTKDRHHGVADVLLDGAAVLFEALFAASKYGSRRPRRSSGSSCVERRVEPTRSANSIVAIFRSPPRVLTV
jgi:hypothetical protein